MRHVPEIIRDLRRIVVVWLLDVAMAIAPKDDQARLAEAVIHYLKPLSK